MIRPGGGVKKSQEYFRLELSMVFPLRGLPGAAGIPLGLQGMLLPVPGQGGWSRERNLICLKVLRDLIPAVFIFHSCSEGLSPLLSRAHKNLLMFCCALIAFNFQGRTTLPQC